MKEDFENFSESYIFEIIIVVVLVAVLIISIIFPNKTPDHALETEQWLSEQVRVTGYGQE